MPQKRNQPRQRRGNETNLTDAAATIPTLPTPWQRDQQCQQKMT